MKISLTQTNCKSICNRRDQVALIPLSGYMDTKQLDNKAQRKHTTKRPSHNSKAYPCSNKSNATK